MSPNPRGGGHSSGGGGGGDHSSGGSTGGDSTPSDGGDASPGLVSPSPPGTDPKPVRVGDDEDSVVTGPVPSHDKVDNDDGEPIPKKNPPSGQDSNYPSWLRTYRPNRTKGPKELGIKKRCRLEDRDIDDAGYIEIEDTSAALKGASWSEGGANYRTDSDGERDVLRNFYFGIQDGEKLNNTGSCAVFFTDVTDEVAFREDDSASESSCESAMSKKCVDSMVKRALDVKTNGNANEVCERIGRAFRDNLDSDCKEYAGNKWNGLVVKPISEFIEPSKQVKKNKDCWPAEDKSKDLALVASINRRAKSPTSIADLDDPTRLLTQYGVMPILTVFYPGDGTLLSKAEAHMTCIKPSAQEQVQSSESEIEDPSSAGFRLGVGGAWDTGMLVLTLWLVYALFGMRTSR